MNINVYLVVIAAITLPMLIMTGMMCFVFLKVKQLEKTVDNLGNDMKKIIQNVG